MVCYTIGYLERQVAPQTLDENRYEVFWNTRKKGGGTLAELRRPMLVRGPLGVVSAMELIIWQEKLRSTGFYMAVAGSLCSAFLFFSVTRGSSILPLLGLTSEGSIKYHIWIGHLLMFFFTAHSIMFVLYWAVTNDLVEMLKWYHLSISNVPGEIAIIFGLAMWVTVHPRIRRKMFELFFYTHHLYIAFMFFYMLHTGFRFFSMILPGFYLFLVDQYLRFLQSRQKVRLVSARVLPCETAELNFSKSLALDYTATSFVSINVPSISFMQWHPFTVSSNSSLEPDKISVIINSNGNWSRKLYEKLASSSPPDRLEVSVEGPYGPTSTDFLRYETLLMVAGGSGIAPMISIIRELAFRKANDGGSVPRVVLICAFKRSVDLTLLNLILPLSGTSIDVSQLEIEIEAFVTRDKSPALRENNQVKTIWFSPHPSDEPLSATLGSRSWLWLGAVIMTSFVMFLILTGLVGRFYIYPKDRNTYKFFSWTARALLNALFLCISIITTATGAFLWNKRRYARQAIRVQRNELASPTCQPSSWFCKPDRELEYLPDQSIIKRTKVQYGARPNLRRMLLHYQGSGTGVLVCGPAKMRHEVAKICASGCWKLTLIHEAHQIEASDFQCAGKRGRQAPCAGKEVGKGGRQAQCAGKEDGRTSERVR
ncbi:ferric reduction oxidase 2-like [Aristolochia californica]|uniref:ferric reduction oxidase 2-like n=1 Tax=Aristolochia californica TaxID=171875 RepID=UPI0035D70854